MEVLNCQYNLKLSCNNTLRKHWKLLQSVSKKKTTGIVCSLCKCNDISAYKPRYRIVYLIPCYKRFCSVGFIERKASLIIETVAKNSCTNKVLRSFLHLMKSKRNFSPALIQNNVVFYLDSYWRTLYVENLWQITQPRIWFLIQEKQEKPCWKYFAGIVIVTRYY